MHENFQKQAKSICVFCEPSVELILQKTTNFLLMCDPFALIPGHLLITSRAHYGCLGEVPVSLQEEVIMLREAALIWLDKAFGKTVTRYEHGRAGHCLAQDVATRSCHHYHEHLIPAPLSLHSALTPRFKCIPFQSELEIYGLFERYNEYLLVSEPGMEKKFYVARSKAVEPHLLRTLAAIALGRPERQEWETYPSCEIMLEGKAQLSSVIEELQFV